MATEFTDKTLTIRALWYNTYQNVRSRFNNAERDVLKGVKIQYVKHYKKGENSPTNRLKIISSSYPQYKPYNRIKGKKSKKQRKVKHQYDITLLLENNTFDSKIIYRVGSQRKVPNYDQVSQKKVKTIFRKTSAKWRKRYTAEQYKKKVIEHKKKAPYLNVGDYISQELGINQDFYFRVAMNLKAKGMLFGMSHHTELYGNTIPFLDKHMVNLLLVLLKSRKLLF